MEAPIIETYTMLTKDNKENVLSIVGLDLKRLDITFEK